MNLNRFCYPTEAGAWRCYQTHRSRLEPRIKDKNLLSNRGNELNVKREIAGMKERLTQRMDGQVRVRSANAYGEDL